MSHSVKVTLVADQEIRLLGDVINIHDLKTIVLDSYGNIIEYQKSTLPYKDAQPPSQGCDYCNPMPRPWEYYKYCPHCGKRFSNKDRWWNQEG